MKERLIGAVVLAVLGVWLIPWLLDGPDDLGEDGPVSLQLPVPQEQVGEIRTETIDLRPPRDTDSPVIAPDDPAIGRRVDVRAVDTSREASRSAAADASRVPGTSSAAPVAAGVDDRAARASAEDVDHTDSPAPSDEGSQAAAVGTNGSAPARTAQPPPVADVRPAPAAETARAPAAEPAVPRVTGDWALQLGSFGDEANARRLAERVSSFGYNPQISNYRAGGRTMYRVRIGPHETRAAAEAAASSLSAHGFVAQVVTVD